MHRLTPVLTVALAIAGFGCSGNNTTTQQTHSGQPTPATPADAATGKTPTTSTSGSEKGHSINAKELTEEFVKDAEAAAKKYDRKVIEVEGIVMDTRDSPRWVKLEGSEGTEINCKFYPEDSPGGKLVSSVKKGQRVRVKGDYSIYYPKEKLLELWPCKTMEVLE